MSSELVLVSHLRGSEESSAGDLICAPAVFKCVNKGRNPDSSEGFTAGDDD